MKHDIEIDDYVLVLSKVTHVDNGHILVVPESGQEEDLGMVIQPQDVLKNYGKQPCSPCRQPSKHIIAVDRTEAGTTILKLENKEITDVKRIEIEDPYTLVKIINELVTVPQHTKIIIDNTGGRGELILEELYKIGANGMLAVFKPRPEKLDSLYRTLDLAIRTGEITLPGFYNRFKDGDAKTIDPGEYLKEYYLKNPQPKVVKKPCKDCP